MTHSRSIQVARSRRTDPGLGLIRTNIARSMIGRVVALSAAAGQIISGVVTAVRADADAPKIVVADQLYDLRQVLTVTPAWLD